MFWRPAGPCLSLSSSLHLGLECQTTATTSWETSRQAPQGKALCRGLETVRLSLEAWLGSGLCCHGDLQLPGTTAPPRPLYGAGVGCGGGSFSC